MVSAGSRQPPSEHQGNLRPLPEPCKSNPWANPWLPLAERGKQLRRVPMPVPFWDEPALFLSGYTLRFTVCAQLFIEFLGCPGRMAWDLLAMGNLFRKTRDL